MNNLQMLYETNQEFRSTCNYWAWLLSDDAPEGSRDVEPWLRSEACQNPVNAQGVDGPGECGVMGSQDGFPMRAEHDGGR